MYSCDAKLNFQQTLLQLCVLRDVSSEISRMLIWCSRFLITLNVLVLNILAETMIHLFHDTLMNKSSKEQHLFEIEKLCKLICDPGPQNQS